VNELELTPPVCEHERAALESALQKIVGEVVAEPRSSSAWWRAGVLDDLDGVEAAGTERSSFAS
jgi:hypothetical protein